MFTVLLEPATFFSKFSSVIYSHQIVWAFLLNTTVSLYFAAPFTEYRISGLGVNKLCWSVYQAGTRWSFINIRTFSWLQLHICRRASSISSCEGRLRQDHLSKVISTFRNCCTRILDLFWMTWFYHLTGTTVVCPTYSTFHSAVAILSNSVGSCDDRGYVSAKKTEKAMDLPVIKHLLKKPSCLQEVIPQNMNLVTVTMQSTPIVMLYAATRIPAMK